MAVERKDTQQAAVNREMGEGELLHSKLPPWRSEGSLAVMKALVGEREVRALVDTGCSTTVVASRLVPGCEGKESSLMTVDGREIVCEGEGNAKLMVQEIRLLVKAIILIRS